MAIYFGAMVGGSILFAKFWIQTTNMGPEAVARQIEASGHADPRVPPRTAGAASGPGTVHPRHHGHLGRRGRCARRGADLIGTLGNASGPGVLLMVGIIINLYEAMGREQLMEMNPLLRRFLGGET